MRKALLATAALGLAGVLLAALISRPDPGFAVGVPAIRLAAELAPGQTVCRDDVDAPFAVARVRTVPAAPGLSATLRGRRVCVRNDGAETVTLLGAPADMPADLLHEGTPQFAAIFTAGEPRSALAQVPDMLERAARFNPASVPLLWLLLAGVAFGLPALLAAAAYSSERSSSRSSTSPERSS
jgi:hypothetical protein